MKFTNEQQWFIILLVVGAALLGLSLGEVFFDEVFDSWRSSETAQLLCGFSGALLIVAAVLGRKFLQLIDTRRKSP